MIPAHRPRLDTVKGCREWERNTHNWHHAIDNEEADMYNRNAHMDAKVMTVD